MNGFTPSQLRALRDRPAWRRFEDVGCPADQLYDLIDDGFVQERVVTTVLENGMRPSVVMYRVTRLGAAVAAERLAA